MQRGEHDFSYIILSMYQSLAVCVQSYAPWKVAEWNGRVGFGGPCGLFNGIKNKRNKRLIHFH